ncbi:MAG: DUF4268 domain-containing protein [Dehalococcoidia bacterium]
MDVNGDKPALARLERVDLRTYWSSEPYEFTPWLARPENLAVLGETIGISLEANAEEKFVGPYRADILCQDTLTGHFVVIENQLERTDHIHLGQLLTYAAGLECVTMIWVAARFTDEHRAALDWLNRTSSGGINFFGLEIELWRIGGSAPAPRFNIASQPNGWQQRVSRAAATDKELSPTAQHQMEFWSAFREYMLERTSPIRIGQPMFPSEMAVALGRTNFTLVILTNNDSVRLKLVLGGPDSKPHFHLLQRDAAALEARLGQLEWLENPGRIESHVMQRLSIGPNQHDDIFRELAERVELWVAELKPRLRALNASDFVANP